MSTHGEQPKVSVVMATYNMAQYVAEAVDSVLAQTYPHVEVVVVNDGSQDDTRAVLDRYADDPRVKVIHQENAGQTVAKNRGLAACTGEFVGFCDADNAWVADKLAVQLPLLTGDDPPGVVYGDVQFIDGEGRDMATPAVERHGGRITGRLLLDNFVTFNTCLVPRAVLEEFGGFDESLRMAIDYDLWLRISTKYEFAYLPHVLARYRIWGGQMSHRAAERLDNAMRMMENFVARYGDSVSEGEVRAAWAYTYTSRGRWLARSGRRREAMDDYSRSLRMKPLDLRTWKSIVRLAWGG